MKKNLAMALVVTMALAMAGCTGTSNKETTAAPTTTAATTAAATTEESDLYNQYYSDLSTQSQEYIFGLATNQYSVDDIPSFVEALDGLGLSQIIDQYQARHDRFIGK